MVKNKKGQVKKENPKKETIKKAGINKEVFNKETLTKEASNTASLKKEHSNGSSRENSNSSSNSNTKVLIIGFISLACAVLFFSGALKDVVGGIFDFAKLTGSFPAWLASGNGVGARGGFIFAFTLVPSVMLALGMISIFEYYGALNAASRIFTIILKPLMGIKGVSAISLIASLQSADAGSSTARMLHDEKKLTDKELLIFASFQFSGAAMLTNFLSSLAPLLQLSDGVNSVPASIAFCFGVILFFKFFGANVMRLYVQIFVK